jgi:hypothetical protein
MIFSLTTLAREAAEMATAGKDIVRGKRTYRLTPVFLGFLIESIQSGNPYLTHLSQGLYIRIAYMRQRFSPFPGTVELGRVRK